VDSGNVDIQAAVIVVNPYSGVGGPFLVGVVGTQMSFDWDDSNAEASYTNFGCFENPDAPAYTLVESCNPNDYSPGPYPYITIQNRGFFCRQEAGSCATWYPPYLARVEGWANGFYACDLGWEGGNIYAVDLQCTTEFTF
jgi:hypothetical protein